MAIGQSGLGLITGSSFYTPQVNLPGSMASFYVPAAVPVPAPALPAVTTSGMGQVAAAVNNWAPYLIVGGLLWFLWSDKSVQQSVRKTFSDLGWAMGR